MHRAHLITDTEGLPVRALHARELTGTGGGVATLVGMRDRRVSAAVGVGTAALTALLTGCAPWLAANPQYASDSAHNNGGGATTKPAGGPPEIAAPKNDLAWKDCVEGLRRRRNPGRAGVTLECASYDADLDPVSGANGTLSIGVVRARSVQTPPDAGPLVFTTGSDVPSSLQLPVWLSRSGADVLRAIRSCRWTGAASGCPARSTAATPSTARRCATRPSSSPVTTRWPTWARSP